MGELPRFAAVTPNSSTGADRPGIPVRAAAGGDVDACAHLATSVSDVDHQTWTQILHRDIVGEDRLLAVATRNEASRALHTRVGFNEVTSDFWFPGASETDGSHVLCRMGLVPA